VKFGAVPNFTLGGGYSGVSGSKTQKFAKIANFIAPLWQTPCPMLVKSVVLCG